MASLLVCVGDRAAWRRELDSIPQLERLDTESLLVVIDTDAQVIAVIDDGETLELAHDVAHLMGRLGATAAARSARVLTPTDVDVLRHELQLGVASLPPPPELRADDASVRELRAGVWREPSSDDARAIYADALQDRGDPRGELIGLQLRRERGAPPSDRERELVRRYAAELCEPLTRYLKSGYVLRRGFLAECVVNDQKAMPPEIVVHPAWSTVEMITSSNRDLLCSPTLMSAKRAGIGEIDMAGLAGHSTPLPFETIHGLPLEPRANGRRTHSGQWVSFFNVPIKGRAPTFDEIGAWRGFIAPGALANVRVLGIRPSQNRDLVPELLVSALGAQLRHLDIITTHEEPNLAAWRTAFDFCDLPLLTIRFWLRLRDIAWTQLDQLVALERTAKGTRVVVEVEEPLAVAQARQLVRVVAQLVNPGIRAVEVRDLGDPVRIVERQPELYRLLAAVFPVIVMRDTPERSLGL